MEHATQLPDGRLLIADGVNPMKVWDGLKPAPIDAGLAAPTTAVTLAASLVAGSLMGTYLAFTRFLDDLGQPSDLSPISAELDATNGATLTIATATVTSPAIITFTGAHGLTTGNRITIEDAQGMPEINGNWSVVVVNATVVTLTDSDTRNARGYTGGATVKVGCSQITYSALPAPATSKAVKLQILRNTDGQADTFYVDVEITLPAPATATSTQDDETLSTGTAVPLLTDDGKPFANAHGIPPAWKSCVTHHLGRAFAAVDVPVKRGAVKVVNGSTLVTGIGTAWVSSLAGRRLYVRGGTKSYEISTVDAAAQTLTLAIAWADATQAYAAYSIRPADAERRLVYYTEAGQYESWPATNAIALQEDGDELVGLMQKGSFVYVLESRHIYKHTFQTNPAVDGATFLSAERGCVNNRCWVQVEDKAYMLDLAGIHAFAGGGDSEALSTSNQLLFQQAINWQAAEYFHAAHFPAQETIRWFVALGGSYLPRHAIVYHYRLQRFWLETYPRPIGASALALVRGARVVLAGSTAAQVLVLGVGTLDGIDGREGTTQGTATAVGPAALTDAAASFPASAAGLWVYITRGRGRGQARQIRAATPTTLTLVQPWTLRPDTSSAYQIAGVPFRWRSGCLTFAPGETETARLVGVYHDRTAADTWLNLRVFYDQENEPLIADHSHDVDGSEGFASERDSPDLVANLTAKHGYVQQRMDSRRELNAAGPREFNFSLDGVAGDEGVVIRHIDLEGVAG